MSTLCAIIVAIVSYFVATQYGFWKGILVYVICFGIYKLISD